MPQLSDYEELNLIGLNVDHATTVGRTTLRANYGDRFRDTAVIGAVGGATDFVLSAGVWPDDEDVAVIGTDSWMEYYTAFLKDRMNNGNEPFIIDWRNRKWLVDLAEPKYGVEVHTSDLFTPDGIELRMVRVKGLTHCRDGSVFDPSLIAANTWGWYKNAESFPTAFPGPIGNAWKNELETSLGEFALLVDGTDVVSVADQLGTFDAVRFSGTTNNGFLHADSIIKTVYEAFFVMKMREATFSNNAGILTAGVTAAALVGGSGTNAFYNLAHGTGYTYKLNNTEHPETAQTAPMNAFGVVHIRFENGITLSDPQVGKDRDFAGRFAEMDMIEMRLCDLPINDDYSEAYSRYLMRYYGIS
jgi:hypothetical protein